MPFKNRTYLMKSFDMTWLHLVFKKFFKEEVMFTFSLYDSQFVYFLTIIFATECQILYKTFVSFCATVEH